MKLDQAIETLRIIHNDIDKGHPDDDLDAIKLCIEALQRIQVGRNNPGTRWNDPLPGEDQ